MAPLEKVLDSELMPPPALKRDAGGALLPYERQRKLRIKRPCSSSEKVEKILRAAFADRGPPVALRGDAGAHPQSPFCGAAEAVPTTPAAAAPTCTMSPALKWCLLREAAAGASERGAEGQDAPKTPSVAATPAFMMSPATPLCAPFTPAKTPLPGFAPLPPPMNHFGTRLRPKTPFGGRRRGFFSWSGELRRDALRGRGSGSEGSEEDIDGLDPREHDRRLLQGLFGDDDDGSPGSSSTSPPFGDFNFKPKCFCCERCFEQFSSVADLKMHHHRFHRGSTELHPCTQCSQKFTSTREVQRHLAQHHNIGVTWSQCPVCPAAFRAREELDQHKLEEHGLRQTWHYCQLCDRRCKRATHLRDHMAHVHGIGVRFWHCSRCPRAFKKDGDLKKHMAEIHGVGVRWFPCDKCGKMFKRPGHLRTHQLIHLRRALMLVRPQGRAPATPTAQPFTPRPVLKGEDAGPFTPCAGYSASLSRRQQLTPRFPVKMEAQPFTPALNSIFSLAQPFTPASQPCTPFADGEEASI